MVTSTVSTSDAALLRRYRQSRDEDAFARLVSRHAAAVRQAALRSTGNAAAAEDVAQATFLVLIGRLGPATRSARLRSDLRPWLAKTCRLCAANWRRSEGRRRRREKTAAVPESVDPSDPSEPGELGEQVAAAVASLRRRDRRLIELRHLDGLPWPDVATRLNLDPAAARVAGGRALDRLRDLLRRRGITATTATVAASLSALVAKASLRSAAPTQAAFSLAKGTLTMLKLKTIAVLSTAALLALGGAGGGLLYAAQEGDAGTAEAGVQRQTGTSTQPPTSNPSNDDPIADGQDPLPFEIAGTLSDGTSVRLVAIGDGNIWWSPTGELLPELEVNVGTLFPRFSPATRPADSRATARSRSDTLPTCAVIDIIGNNVTQATAEAVLADLDDTSVFGEGLFTATPIDNGARLILATVVKPSTSLSLSLHVGVGDRAKLIETSFDVVGSNRRELPDLGPVAVSPVRMRPFQRGAEPEDGILVHKPWRENDDSVDRLQEITVEWLGSGDSFKAGKRAPRSSSLHHFFSEGGSLFFTFKDPPTSRPPTVQVWLRATETIRFYNIANEPGGGLYAGVVVQ